MQRLHYEDTAARCEETNDYQVLCLPMEFDPARKCRVFMASTEDRPYKVIEDPRTEKGELLDPERFPREVVEADKRALGQTAYQSQFQQNPGHPEGIIFKQEHIQRWSSLPEGMRIIITVDCAFKDTKSSDFVAIQAWGVKRPNYYLIDQIYGRFNVLKTCDKISEMKMRYPRAVGTHIEDKANGPAVIQIMGGEHSGLVPWSPKAMSKVSRAEAVAALFESGNVFIPPDSEAPWAGEYVTELTRFPLVSHDDRVDATTMALLILHQPRHSSYAEAVKKMRA